MLLVGFPGYAHFIDDQYVCIYVYTDNVIQ